MLVDLEATHVGAKVKSIPCGNPCLADDVALVTTSPKALQTLLDVAQRYANKWKFQYNASKCNILTFGCACLNNEWTINNNAIRIANKETHLGIILSSNLKNNDAVDNACKKGRNMLHSITRLGTDCIHTKPLTLVSIYKKVILPSILFGC